MENLAKKLEISLPHGESFKFIHKLIDISTEGLITTEFSYSGSEVVSARDHFPGNQICPAIFLIEAMAQSTAQIAVENKEFVGLLPTLAGIDKFRIHQSILPGTRLRIESKITYLRSKFGTASCRVFDKDKEVAMMDFLFALVSP